MKPRTRFPKFHYDQTRSRARRLIARSRRAQRRNKRQAVAYGR